MTTTSLRALEQEKYNSLCLQLENNLSIVQINAFCYLSAKISTDCQTAM